ncbi:hypothetical protein JCM8547_005492 [Rhodosporidiobolus lusitaniae]
MAQRASYGAFITWPDTAALAPEGQAGGRSFDNGIQAATSVNAAGLGNSVALSQEQPAYHVLDSGDKDYAMDESEDDELDDAVETKKYRLSFLQQLTTGQHPPTVLKLRL